MLKLAGFIISICTILRGKLFLTSITFLTTEFLLRLYLVIIEYKDMGPLTEVFGIGLFNDLKTVFMFIPILVLYFVLSPKCYQNSKVDNFIRFLFFSIFCFLLLFISVSEIIFWSEFRCRFNFVAVDYLIYTNEVIGNIKESYPIYWILNFIGVISFFTSYTLNKYSNKEIWDVKKKIKISFLCFLFCTGTYFFNNDKTLNNSISQEICQNGIDSFFYALKTSKIEFDKFYLTTKSPDLKFEENTQINPNNYNVIIIGMESMSAEFMKYFGNNEGITPNLDNLVYESVFFSNLYATGTRTIRGLEAIFLGIPPSPGDSIIKRPNNGNLYSLGSVLKEFGYRNMFLYGGYGYFDNMNSFFSKNYMEIIDRVNIEHVNFSNIWGVCDEDLFDQVIKEADKKLERQSPFFALVMTTSNHRPYTYPIGKIDIPSKTGRGGAIKYADFAIGEFLRAAKTKPWFKNTIFVIVADHTAGSMGKVELTLSKHHIPCFIYAPYILKPKIIDQVCSQIDIMPTILKLLGLPYRCISRNLLDKEFKQRAFISNYQKLGLYNYSDNLLTIIKPIKEYSVYKGDVIVDDQKHLNETISYYEWSSKWEENLKNKKSFNKNSFKKAA